MATKEAAVKKKVVNVLNSYGAYYFYPVTGGFGRSGVPAVSYTHLTLPTKRIV